MVVTEKQSEAGDAHEDRLWRLAARGRKTAIQALFLKHRGLVHFFVQQQVSRSAFLDHRLFDDYVGAAFIALLGAIEFHSKIGIVRGYSFSHNVRWGCLTAVARCHWELRGVRKGTGRLGGLRACSLDQERTGPDGESYTLAERVPDPFARDGAVESEDTDTRLKVKAVVLGLPERERRLVVLKVWHGWTFRRIGERFGCTRQWVDQLWQKAIERLRRRLLQAFGGIPEIEIA
jgi:RNA polymerase sigma factor (sigma-70 family)